MQDLIHFASNLGFSPPGGFDLNGKLVRFARDARAPHKKNAWYIGWQHFTTKTGEPYNIAIFGDWSTGDRHEFKANNIKLAREDQEIVKKRLKEAREQAEAERRERQEETAKRAEKLVALMRPVAASPYLEKKQITDLHGAGTVMNDVGERLVIVPLRDETGKLWSVQRIFPDGSKRFLASGRVAGCFHVMGDLEDEAVYLAEGFATAATIRQATGQTVLVCFNAANLIDVAKAVRRKWTNKSIIICGDDDAFTDGNPGRAKAEEAAKLALGKAVFPKFKNNSSETKLTDFNDLHLSEGIDAVKAQLQAGGKPELVGYICLGFDGTTHFFFDMSSNDIKKLSNFSSTELFELMPLEYWEATYAGQRGVRWDQAKSDIKQASKNVGAFDPFRVRGTGVWFDRGRTIVNTGRSLIVDGQRSAMSEFKTNYVYVATRNKMPAIHANPLSVNETKPLLDACELLQWRDNKAWVFLSGWIAIARIAGAMPIRPHLWLTGGSGTGKSTVMDKIIRPALGSEASRLYLQGGTTEAGIRQSIKADSLPIIFDEFETNNEATKERVQNLVELLRQAWSHTQGHVVKGSASGVASHYALSFAALVSSIRVSLDNDADRSRFTVVELAPHGSRREQWAQMKESLKLITEDFGERLFSRMIKMTPIVLQSYEVAADALSNVVNQRFGQQYGMLIAGWYALMSDTPLTDKIAIDLVEELGFAEERDEVNESTDERDCFSHLCTTKVTVQDQCGSRFEKTVGEILKGGAWFEVESLKSYGILSEPNEDYIYIANEHASLRKYIFARTRWELCWRKSLLRLPDAGPSRHRWFGGKQSRSVKIPKSLLNL